MEERKKIEIDHYNRGVDPLLGGEQKESGSRVNFDPLNLGSYVFLRQISEDIINGKKVLDYGCGSGLHLKWLSSVANEVVGIDLSDKSLGIAQKIVLENKLNNVKLVEMDCEKLEFPDNSFDVIFDGGTFSSLDIKVALPELKRVLKPGGHVVGIETFGHNPFTNVKRKFNKLTKNRTAWAESHILNNNGLKEIEECFGNINVYYFHLISWIMLPFLNFPGANFMLKLLERVDKLLIYVFPFLKRYSFKVVFMFSKIKT